MRAIYRIVPLLAMAAAMIAPSASPASASVEISDEPSGQHCNPCFVTADSVVNAEGFVGERFIVHFGGMEVNTGICDDEFDMNIYENGAGHIFNQQFHGAAATCGKKPCGATSQESGDGTEWPMTISETAIDTLVAEIRMCFQALTGGQTTCHIDGMRVIHTEHHTILDAHDLECEDNPSIEFTSRIEINGHPLEIIHSPNS